MRPAARPSSPSVRFTALLVAVITNVTNGTYSHAAPIVAGTTSMYLRNGSVVDAPGSALSGIFQM